ncbi:MAG: hypothetical protein AB4060_13625 [Crocosphaera sp.]
MGLKKGMTNNPTGKNQWENIKADKPIAVRLLKKQDEAVREIASSEDKAVSEVISEAVDIYLKIKQTFN